MIFLNPRAGSLFAGMRIGLLGGSFNPAHEGHRAMSLYALKRLGLNQVWWLVSPHNPLKPEKNMAPLASRLEKARMAARHPKIMVTDIETRIGTRYTADTLSILRARFSRTHFVWLMGADNLRQIPRWRRWTDIFKEMPVAVFRRPGCAIEGKAARRFASSRHAAGYGKKLALHAPPAWLVLDNPLNLLSATALRRHTLYGRILSVAKSKRKTKPSKNKPAKRKAQRKPAKRNKSAKSKPRENKFAKSAKKQKIKKPVQKASVKKPVTPPKKTVSPRRKPFPAA